VTAVLVIAAVGVGSYLQRASMLVLAARTGLPPSIERAARVAVPVSFAALAAVAVVDPAAGSDPQAAPVVGAAVGVAAVRLTGRRLAALVAGMPTLWLLSALA
jgi:branched-subunit amino acid transport protein